MWENFSALYTYIYDTKTLIKKTQRIKYRTKIIIKNNLISNRKPNYTHITTAVKRLLFENVDRMACPVKKIGGQSLTKIIAFIKFKSLNN